MSLNETYRFGNDLRMPLLDPDQLDALPVTPSGDLKTVSGRQNVVDAIRRRMVTSAGTMTHRPDYGVGLIDMIGRSTKPSNISLTISRAKRNLKRDTRVTDSQIRATVGVLGTQTSFSGVRFDLDVRLRADDGFQRMQIEVDNGT